MKKKPGESFRRGAKLLKSKRPDEYKNLTEGPLAKAAPKIAQDVIAHIYGEIWSDPDLDMKAKALVTISTLAAMGGAEPQLKSHIGGALKCGWTEKEIVAVFRHVGSYAGAPRGINAVRAATEVFAAKPTKRPARVC